MIQYWANHTFWPVYNHDFLKFQTYNPLIDHIFSYRRILVNSYNGNCRKIVRISRIVRVSWPPLYIYFFENQNIFVLGCSLKFRLHIPLKSPKAGYQTFFIPEFPIFVTQKYSNVPNRRHCRWVSIQIWQASDLIK